jgi:hypothetical protein
MLKKSVNFVFQFFTHQTNGFGDIEIEMIATYN